MLMATTGACPWGCTWRSSRPYSSPGSALCQQPGKWAPLCDCLIPRGALTWCLSRSCLPTGSEAVCPVAAPRDSGGVWTGSPGGCACAGFLPHSVPPMVMLTLGHPSVPSSLCRTWSQSDSAALSAGDPAGGPPSWGHPTSVSGSLLASQQAACGAGHPGSWHPTSGGSQPSEPWSLLRREPCWPRAFLCSVLLPARSSFREPETREAFFSKVGE